jgi:hypothetical protein
MDTEKPVVLLIGPRGIYGLEVMEHFLCWWGLDARICKSAQEAVEIAISGKADTLVYVKDADMTGPETFESIRWGYSTAGFVYQCHQWDPLRHRIIEDVRARVLVDPMHLKDLKNAVAAVSPASAAVFEAKTNRVRA